MSYYLQNYMKCNKNENQIEWKAEGWMEYGLDQPYKLLFVLHGYA